MSKYYMHGEEWTETVIVDFNKTPKTITIKPISLKPRYTNGCIDKLWDKGSIVIRKPKLGSRIKMTRDFLQDWKDGTYTLYPERAGIPYYLEPVKEVNNE